MKHLLSILLLAFAGFYGKTQTDSNLVWVEGGIMTIGNEEFTDAQPTFEVNVKGFWIQQREVTNKEFEDFVKATNYKTLAERNGGSYVFSTQRDSNDLEGADWWKFNENASWKNPYGNDSLPDNFAQHPAVHIAYEDACAYCEWLNMRLPTEIEWETAARQNGEVENYNIWQGNFPDYNTISDGFLFTAPVESFSPGTLGIYDMQGNVWEWCLDPYHQNAYFYAKQWGANSDESIVPRYYDEFSPDEETRVIRGGSFLCAENSCSGYKIGIRMRSSVKMTFQHIGFRCAKGK